MEKDFHFSLTYVVARLAGFAHESSLVIATSSQYVDDTVSEGIIRFKTGEQYARLSCAHEKWNPKIAISADERKVWVPFHFLPAGKSGESIAGDAFHSSLICRPNSLVAQEMLNHCIRQKGATHSLHRLGITAHVYVDTWAHQGFAGINHRMNRATRIQLSEKKHIFAGLAHLKRTIIAQGVPSFFARLTYLFLSKIFPMGHGAVLHYPDWPFLKWSYVNHAGEKVDRDNPRDFIEAAKALFAFFIRYQEPTATAETQAAMIPADFEKISQLLSTVHAEDVIKRCAIWHQAIAQGEFSFGPAEIQYCAKGPKSWKFAALGTDSLTDHFWERFDYTPEFVNSNWKHFHDAALSHQHEVLHHILPKFGICAI